MRMAIPDKEKFSLLVAMVLFCSLGALAQEKAQPDFTGTWLYEKSTSLHSSMLYRESRSKVYSIFDQWVITQVELEVAIHQSFRYDLIHHKTGERVKAAEMERKWTVFADGRGDRHDTEGAESVTNWDKTKLVTTFYSKPDQKGKKSKVGMIEMMLAESGKTLVISWKGFAESDDYILRQVFPHNRRDYYKLRQN